MEKEILGDRRKDVNVGQLTKWKRRSSMLGKGGVPARFIIQKDKLRVSKHSQILRPASATAAPFFGHASQSLTKDCSVDLVQQEWKVALL